MDFNKIASTQEFEGNTIDAIFPKKRSTRKRKVAKPADSLVFNIRTNLQDDDSPENRVATQQSTPENFQFTNENIFRKQPATSTLFAKYFPPEVLSFTSEELAEINDLYAGLQEQRANEDVGLLTKQNVNDLDKSTCPIERFLEDHNNLSQISPASDCSPPFFQFDSNSPGVQ